MDYSNNASRIIALAGDITEAANAMIQGADNALLDSGAALLADGHSPLSPAAAEQKLLSVSERIYKIRRRREMVFEDMELFADPAWDMLLDLFSAHVNSRRISVTSACLAANVPTTTALRWIGILEQAGLLQRERDEADARRMFVRLTQVAIEKLTKVLG